MLVLHRFIGKWWSLGATLRRHISHIRDGNLTIEDDMSVTHAQLLETTLSSHFPTSNKNWPALSASSPLPVGSHLVFFNHAVPEIELSQDGYDNLQAPTISTEGAPLVRRWRRGRLEFNHENPLKLGIQAVCTENVSKLDISENAGSGQSSKYNVNITRTMKNKGSSKVSIIEKRSLYYFPMSKLLMRKMSNLVSGRPLHKLGSGLAQPTISQAITASKVLIFRYSALSFNSHFIHYDADYSREVEGLANIVVQGPLMVTLLLRWIALELPGMQLNTISYENIGSVMAGEQITLNAAPFLNNSNSSEWKAWITRQSSDGKVLVVFTASMLLFSG